MLRLLLDIFRDGLSKVHGQIELRSGSSGIRWGGFQRKGRAGNTDLQDVAIVRQEMKQRMSP